MPDHISTSVRQARIARPDDFVILEVELRGFGYKKRNRVLHAIAAGLRAATLIVRFPPQHIAERAYFETDGKIPVKPSTDPDAAGTAETLDPPPVAAMLAGQSRLVFTVPNDFRPIP